MSKSHVPTLPCFCASLRRASRALTQVYEQALRPLGLRGTQFTVLQALSLAGEVPQGELGRILAMDSTTLTRTLEIMRRRSWIATHYGKDRRERWLSLAKAGEAEFKRVLPHWEKVQARLRRRFGNKRWNNFINFTNQVTNEVTE
jgi:DNA-binding MarR family transcriptional regulator